MQDQTTEKTRAYAKWLAQACKVAGLDAEQYGESVWVIAEDHRLSEQVTCQPDENGTLRWLWSWGSPITHLRDRTRILTPDEVDELVAAIKNVVSIQVRR